MTLQNRVTPGGEIIADPARGTLMGNCGILHDAKQRLGAARWRHPHWIFCRLAFKGRWRPVMAPHRYTELFFLDEATALAAGHRPCAECRREDYRRWQAAWPGPDTSADAMDRVLHADRLDGHTKRTYTASLAELPDGVFVLRGDVPFLVLGDKLLRWTTAGYLEHTPRPARARTTLITPPSLVEVLRAGWRPNVPLLHPSAAPEQRDGMTAPPGGPG